MGKLFDGKLVFTQIPLLLKYLPVTMELAVTAMIASLILGLLLALVKIKKNTGTETAGKYLYLGHPRNADPGSVICDLFRYSDAPEIYQL